MEKEALFSVYFLLGIAHCFKYFFFFKFLGLLMYLWHFEPMATLNEECAIFPLYG